MNSLVMRCVLMAVVSLAVSVSCLAGGDRDAARIIGVERAVKGYDDESVSRRMVERRVPKLTDELRDQSEDEAIFHVVWVPPAGGLPPGAVLHFDYRQERARRTRTLKIQYPFGVTAQRRATFEISSRAYRRGGDVTAWRVRLVRDDRVIAKLDSPTWK